MRDLTAETFGQEIGAEFTEFTGRVFKDFDEEVHVRDFDFNPDWPTFGACDYGFTNPFVWLVIQVNPVDGTTYVVDEMYERGMTIDEAASEILGRGLRPDRMREFFPDPASPGDTRALEKKLRLTGRDKTGGELTNRLRIIRSALKVRNLHLEEGHPQRLPRLLINRRCTNTIREMNDYRYPKTLQEAEKSDKNPKENPMKKDDHTPEALGRFFVGYFGMPSAEERVIVRSGEWGR
jgi:hypothetical protein